MAEADLDDALARLDDEELQRYVRHVVTEDARVLAAVEVLRGGRVEDLGPLLTASHASMRDDFRITVPEVDTAVEALLAAGAVGARMTGGGFGGCVIGLVPESGLDAAGDAVRRAFADAGFGEPALFTAAPAAGARAVYGGAVGGARDRLDEGLEQLGREVVAHALDQQQLGAGDRGRGGAAAADVDHLVGRAVHDQGRHAQAAQPRRAVGLLEDGHHVPHRPAGAVAAVEGLPGALGEALGVRGPAG